MTAQVMMITHKPRKRQWLLKISIGWNLKINRWLRTSINNILIRDHLWTIDWIKQLLLKWIKKCNKFSMILRTQMMSNRYQLIMLWSFCKLFLSKLKSWGCNRKISLFWLFKPHLKLMMNLGMQWRIY